MILPHSVDFNLLENDVAQEWILTHRQLRQNLPSVCVLRDPQCIESQEWESPGCQLLGGNPENRNSNLQDMPC